MLEELLNQAKLAVELGKKAGADDVVASVSWGRGLKFEWREGRLEKVQESTSRRLGLAVYVDGRFSTCSTNDLDSGRLAKFAEETVALTRFLEVDPYRKITPPELYAGRSEINLEQTDPSLADLSREKRIEWCQEMDERSRADKLVITAENRVTDSHSMGARATSNGFEAAEECTGVWLYAEVSVPDGEKRPEDYYYAGGSHLSDLPSAASIADEALRRARGRIGSKKISSRRTTMVVDPEAGSGLLGRVLGALSGGSIQQKRSFLADGLNQQIASPVLTMTDDPLRVRGLSSQHHDGEGISSRKRTIIEKGVLKTFFIDTYYGRKLGWEPTTGGASNMIFDHGPDDLAKILSRVKDGIYVTSWLGGNADMATGNFSFGLCGHLIEGGELVAPVSEMNVTGNYGDILNQLVELGNDPLPWSSFRTPTLVFEDVQFSGI
ncbi:MAG: PmbA protein [Planctomycetota bacterium]|jgi:PmbA protein